MTCEEHHHHDTKYSENHTRKPFIAGDAFVCIGFGSGKPGLIVCHDLSPSLALRAIGS
jgi:hypothetical protein